MELIYKKLKKSGRGMYIYYPSEENRTAFKRCSITVLRDGNDEASVRRLLEEGGMAELARREQAILAFPNPEEGGWNYDFGGGPDDVAAFADFQDAMSKPDDEPLECRPDGIPTYQAMISTWHPMMDTRYLIGIGDGAKMALTLAACVPEQVTAVLSLGGVLCEAARQRAVEAVMPVCLLGSDKRTENYFNVVNETESVLREGQWDVWRNRVNPLQCVMTAESQPFTAKLLEDVWTRLFSKVRRTNTGAHGDCEPRMDFAAAGFEIYLDDNRLEEEVKTPHTWFVHVPESVKKGDKKVPLMMFYHGGSDNPAEAAEMSKFHEVGEREGFITVYPWGTNKTQWNSVMDPKEPDDVGFAVALIRYMLEHYPVDPQRVYLSGFSNGAAHAQVVGMLYPELIAAVCHIDSNWPGLRGKPCEVDYQKVTPMRLALEKKKEYDYRMPVWYTYGTREMSYPVYRKSSQQYQYDFWKLYNNIEVLSTPPQEEPDPCGCGVPGQVQERLRPSKRHQHHFYDVQRFYTRDENHWNLYNYVMMHDKGHDVAQMDAALGWEYVKQFRRLPDGSLGLV